MDVIAAELKTAHVFQSPKSVRAKLKRVLIGRKSSLMGLSVGSDNARILDKDSDL